MKDYFFYLNIFFIAISFAGFVQTKAKRSVFRPTDPMTPTIQVRWENSGDWYTLQDYHLEEYPLFHTYDERHFTSRTLPTARINYRNDKEQSIDGAVLSELIEHVVQELLQTQKRRPRALKEFTHFTILKKRDFVWKNRTGTIVLKFKDYPFVVKLFRETPESFVCPFDKGFEPTCFFLMGGGANRHILGLTRIKNLEYVKTRFHKDDEWRTRIDLPRKWYWAPKNNRMLTVTGTNIGTSGKTLHTKYPSVYAVVVDAIDIDRVFTLKNYEDRQLALSTSKYLRSYIDAHINNFVVEKGTGKVVIIDTEHFPTVVGLRRELPGKGYVGWYGRLAAKRLRNTYGRTKYARKAIQQRGPSPLSLPT